MKRVITSLLAILFVLPMVFPLAACTTETGGENMANYLYNGVELPELPKYDTAAYPYALISIGDGAALGVSGSKYYYFTVCSSSAYVKNGQFYVASGTNLGGFMMTDSQELSDLCSGYGMDVPVNAWGAFVAEETPSAEYSLGGVDGLLWTSHDILNADNSIYLAASNPVPVGGSKLTISTGGSANGDGMALYNGVMLPNIDSVWDKETYPYAYCFEMDGAYGVYFASSESYYAEEDGVFAFVAAPPYTGFELEDGTWNLYETVDSGAETFVAFPAQGLNGIWASSSLVKADGSVYISASDPIPLDGMNVITWDGNTDGLEAASPNIGWYRVSSETPTASQLDGGSIPSIVALSNGEFAPIGTGYVEPSEFGNGWAIQGITFVAFEAGETNGLTIPSAGTYFMRQSDEAYISLLAYPATSGGVTDTTATVNFSCKDLLYTDSVYRIKAWVYKVADGLDVTLAPTWTSDLFAGPSHSESHTFTGLTPATEYGIYAVIWSETDGAATEHNATAAFTTLEGEGLNATIAVDSKLVEYNTCVYNVTVSGLPEDYTTHEGNFWLTATLHDGTTAEEKMVFSGSPTAQFYFGDLEPETEYTVTFELFYANEDYTKGASTGITFEDSFTTGELPDGGFDRDAFLLGFASGLGCTAATKTDADHNAWMQGYIVGDELRAAITTQQGFRYEVPALSAAVRVVAEFYDDVEDTMLFNAHNGAMILGVSTPNDGTFADRYGDTRYMIPIPAEASKVTVKTTDPQVTMAQFIGVNGANGVYTKAFSSAREAVYSYEFPKGTAQYMAIDLIYEDKGAVTVPWDYDATATTTVMFT